MPSRLAGLARTCLDRPGAFYAGLLATLAAVQTVSVLAFLEGGDLVRSAIPAYTHVLSFTIGTIFVFRGLQLLGFLVWTSLVDPAPLPPPYTPDRSDLPEVTVQIPVRNEPLEVARFAIDSAFALDYPADRLEVQIIDNSDSEAATRPIEEYVERKASELAARGQAPIVTFLHRDGVEGFKARNLNLGMAVAKGFILLLLDADSRVPPDTLWRALPYFEDPRLAFVQLRVDAVNEDANLVTKAASVTIRVRFRLMAMRDRQGIVQFDGHNGLLRRAALEEVGGWVEQLSEDLATSVELLLAGHRARFADLPSGELVPARFPELIKQRRRWATGTMQFLRSHGWKILSSPRLRWFEKLDLMYSVLNIGVEALTCVLILTFAPLPAATVLQLLVVFAVVPTYLASGFHLGKTLLRQASVIFVISAVLPSLLLGAANGVLGREQSFSVTRKVGGQRLSVRQVARSNAFGFSIAVLFFVVGGALSAGPADFFDRYLAGTLVMGSVLVAPFVLNYTTTRGQR